jgi:hypothetical protein
MSRLGAAGAASSRAIRAGTSYREEPIASLMPSLADQFPARGGERRIGEIGHAVVANALRLGERRDPLWLCE